MKISGSGPFVPNAIIPRRRSSVGRVMWHRALLVAAASAWLRLLDSQNYVGYPQSSLQCMSSLTKPDMRLICPLNRNTWCVKETSTLRQDLCGYTQYFGDMFVVSQCEYKKCAAECTPGTYSFFYKGVRNTRTVYCCNDQNYCNSGLRTYSKSIILIIICILSIFVSFFIL